MESSHAITADEKAAGLRLDAFLAGQLPHLSRSRIQAAIKGGAILVEGRAAKPHASVRAGSAITVPGALMEPEAPGSPSLRPRPDIRLAIVHEDGDIMVVDKPSGMLMHPAVPADDDTLANAAIAHAPAIAGVGESAERPGIMHRLDKEASGLVVLAKSKKAYASLKKQFAGRTAKKEYLVLVEGEPPADEGTVRLAIGRKSGGGRMSARPEGIEGDRPAVTHYDVKERFAKATLLSVRTETGRTHQIRAHMKALGCPVCGDSLYGNPKPLVRCGRLFLHAGSLGFTHPGTKEKMSFAAPLPKELDDILAKLRS